MTRHDDKGRVYEHADESTTDEDFAAMVADRDAADAANLEKLRAAGRVWNDWHVGYGDGRSWDREYRP